MNNSLEELPSEMIGHIFTFIKDDMEIQKAFTKDISLRLSTILNSKYVQKRINPCTCHLEYPCSLYNCKHRGEHPCRCNSGKIGLICYCRHKGKHPCMCHLEVAGTIYYCKHKGEHHCVCHIDAFINECRKHHNP